MPRVRLSRLAAICTALAVLLTGAVVADAALVRVNGIVLHADGGFQPSSLPRGRFVGIDFEGFFDIASSTGPKPPVLEEAVIDFDRDGRLSAGGLPVCPPERLANASPEDARKLCSGAIVGRGRVEAVIDTPSGPAPASSPLTLFNGPPQNGMPTVILHARIGAGNQTIAIVIPIERRPGEFRYRATLVFPPIDEGRGAITHVQVEVGRRFSVDGKKRSYVSARCRDGILRTHGRFRFADGTIVDGSVEKACTAR
ncbi:MAG TPA: hypothetical protein VGO36_03210 [Solirubrobacterales bacterium]|jgi:hypothetical protein|nr:hypothetical protein [Solirubrobacterales bacterium]